MLSKAKGNMYPWVTHTWNPIQMNCLHSCKYCYVNKMNKRFGKSLSSNKLNLPFPNLGGNKVIFVESFGDLFSIGLPYAQSIPFGWIEQILFHCAIYKTNTYVFQTKNPALIYYNRSLLPKKHLIGTTIETNRQEILDIISKAPPVLKRMQYMSGIQSDKFVSIEPIIDFDPGSLAAIVKNCDPKFVSIGADSKKSNLQEPEPGKIYELIELIKEYKIEVKLKNNLARLLK